MRLFPFVFDTVVRPGIIFNWGSKIHIRPRESQWRFVVGSHFWIQTHESLSRIKGPGDQVPKLLIEKAKKPFAYRSKLLAGATYRHEGECRTWYISLNVGTSSFNGGVGDDFSAALSFETDF